MISATVRQRNVSFLTDRAFARAGCVRLARYDAGAQLPPQILYYDFERKIMNFFFDHSKQADKNRPDEDDARTRRIHKEQAVFVFAAIWQMLQRFGQYMQ